ncbi:MAG: DUF3667 domain-containing protein [Acidobacteriota bacterium]
MATGTQSSKCANCGADLHGPYCSLCGQAETEGHPPTVGHFLHDLTHEILHVDGKIGRSAKALICSPGLLTQQYWAGRIAHWVRPLRLFLIAAALHLFLATGSGPANLQFHAFQKPGTRDISLRVDMTLPTQPPPNSEMLPEADQKKLKDSFDRSYLAVRYASPAIFALVSLILFRRRQPWFVQHLIFALHFYAVWYTLAVISGLLSKWHEYLAFLSFAALPYLFFTLRRLYPLSAARATIASLTLNVALILIEGLLAFGAAMLTARAGGKIF